MSLFILVGIVFIIIVICGLGEAEAVKAKEQIMKKWETHPLRNKILNNTIILVDKEITSIANGNLPTYDDEFFAPKHEYFRFITIYVLSSHIDIGIETMKRVRNSKREVKPRCFQKLHGYSCDMTGMQKSTLTESLMRGLEHQYATDSEILISRYVIRENFGIETLYQPSDDHHIVDRHIIRAIL